jgi:hypothetical protein
MTDFKAGWLSSSRIASLGAGVRLRSHWQMAVWDGGSEH